MVGGLARNQDIPSLIGRKLFMALAKSQAKKEIREGKQLTINGVLKASKTLNVVPK
jgi:hypothetical protein